MEVIPVLGCSTSAFSWSVSRTWHVRLGFSLPPLRIVSYCYREQLTATALLVCQEMRVGCHRLLPLMILNSAPGEHGKTWKNNPPQNENCGGGSETIWKSGSVVLIIFRSFIVFLSG